MWNLPGKKQSECSLIRDFLEQAPAASQTAAPPQRDLESLGFASLAPRLRAHLQTCPQCQSAVEEFLVSRELLRAVPRATVAAPWFPARVMAAIAAREAELRRSLETWAFVPRLAARLTWVSALALLLAGTWLYEMPRSTKSSNETSIESLFDSSSAGAAQDDVLTNQMERAE